MTTGDSQSLQTTNTGCPIKSQLIQLSTISALALAFQHDCRIDDPRWRKPYSNLALMPTDRMGPPPGASPPMRMTASWSESNDPTEYKCAARDPRPMASSPRILRRQATVRRRSFAKKPVSQFIIAPPTQASRRCETQAPLGGKRQALLPFRSLDPFRVLREPDRRRRDEERLSRSEQRTDNKPKHHLTGKAPYKFESVSLQRRVMQTRFGPDAIAGLASAHTKLMRPDGTLTSTATEGPLAARQVSLNKRTPCRNCSPGDSAPLMRLVYRSQGATNS
jgi:hypothetical protein